LLIILGRGISCHDHLTGQVWELSANHRVLPNGCLSPKGDLGLQFLDLSLACLIFI
jgi:hypothetical protein